MLANIRHFTTIYFVRRVPVLIGRPYINIEPVLLLIFLKDSVCSLLSTEEIPRSDYSGGSE